MSPLILQAILPPTPDKPKVIQVIDKRQEPYCLIQEDGNITLSGNNPNLYAEEWKQIHVVAENFLLFFHNLKK